MRYVALFKPSRFRKGHETMDRIELKIFVQQNWNLETEELIYNAEQHFGEPCREKVLNTIRSLMVVR